MSLRFRLIGLVLLGLLVSLAVGGMVILVIASQSVRTEMHSALVVARQTIEQGIRELDRSPDPRRELNDLVATFSGSRHLRVRLSGEAAVPLEAAGKLAPSGNMPRWFVWLIRVEPESDRVPVAIAGDATEIVVTTDSANEIQEVWDEMNGTLIVLALFGGQVIPLVYLSIGRALRPLDRLAAAMEQVGEGDYEVRVGGPLAPELARLRDSFNRMAERLAAADADNRRLNEQMLTLQEEERSDIARDLHDEFGPLLFAINVDVANMARLAREQRVELLPQVESMAATAHQLQRQVRGMLGRLRQTGGMELGLAEALEELVAFWRRRYPRIDYRLDLAGFCGGFGMAIDTTIYRIVQEGLSNAVRHGNPCRITISVHPAQSGGRDEAIVAVCDDGGGMPSATGLGYGLIGMEERVRGVGGRLTFHNSPNGGFELTAVLPIAREAAPAPPRAPAEFSP